MTAASDVGSRYIVVVPTYNAYLLACLLTNYYVLHAGRKKRTFTLYRYLLGEEATAAAASEKHIHIINVLHACMHAYA